MNSRLRSALPDLFMDAAMSALDGPPALQVAVALVRFVVAVFMRRE